MGFVAHSIVVYPDAADTQLPAPASSIDDLKGAASDADYISDTSVWWTIPGARVSSAFAGIPADAKNIRFHLFCRAKCDDGSSGGGWAISTTAGTENISVALGTGYADFDKYSSAAHPSGRAWLVGDFTGTSDAPIYQVNITLNRADSGSVYLSAAYIEVEYETFVLEWSDAAADPRIPKHWLLDLFTEARVAGVLTRTSIARFSERGLLIDGVNYFNGMAVTANPRISVDPYTSRASHCVGTVSLAPIPVDPVDLTTLRLYDLAATSPLYGLRCTLYRWAEGTALTERQTILDGTIDQQLMGPDGAFVFTLTSLGLAYDADLTPVVIESEAAGTYTYARQEDIGRGVSLIYAGDVLWAAGVPLPVAHLSKSHPGGQTVGAAALTDFCYLSVGLGTLPAPLGVRKNGAAFTNYTVVTYTLPRGETCTVLKVPDAEADMATAQFDADLSGYEDADSGRYTGGAGGTGDFVLHPASIVWHMAEKWAKVPAEYVDDASFEYIRDTFHPGRIGALQQLPDNVQRLSDIQAEVGRILRCTFIHEEGLYRAKMLDFDLTPSVDLIEGENLEDLTPPRWCGRDKLRTHMALQFLWWYTGTAPDDWNIGWNALYALGPSDDTDLQAMYDLLVGAIERPGQRETVDARCIVDYPEGPLGLLIVLHGKVRRTTAATVPLDSTAGIYKTVRATWKRWPSTDGTGAVLLPFAVTGKTYGLRTDTLELLEA